MDEPPYKPRKSDIRRGGFGMKQGKKTTKREKMPIKFRNLNPDKWLTYKKVAKELHLVHRDTRATQVIVNS